MKKISFAGTIAGNILITFHLTYDKHKKSGIKQIQIFVTTVFPCLSKAMTYVNVFGGPEIGRKIS